MTPLETKAVFESYGWDFSQYRKFICVRNPWARLVSLYEHIRREGSVTADFDSWLQTIETSGAGAGGEDWQRWRRYGSWSIENYIADEQGELMVDKVFKTETVSRELPVWLETIGVSVNHADELPESNQGAYEKRYQDYYNDKTANHVASLYRYDIEKFGYEFDV